MSLHISYSKYFTKGKMGRAYYPKRLGRISIYLSSHLHYCRTDIERIVNELNITLLHEISHIFHIGQQKRIHDWDGLLGRIIEESQ